MAGIFIENRRNGGQHAIRKEIISQAETSGIRFVSRFRVERRKGEEFIHDVWPAFQTVGVPRFDLVAMKPLKTADTLLPLENFLLELRSIMDY